MKKLLSLAVLCAAMVASVGCEDNKSTPPKSTPSGSTPMPSGTPAK